MEQIEAEVQQVVKRLVEEALEQAKETRASAILRDAADIYVSLDIAVIKQKWALIEPKAVRCFTKDFG